MSAEESERDALRDLSKRIGNNPLLVQASTGNTSVKIGDVLWIKASGKWMTHADDHDFLVPVGLENARRSVQQNTTIWETGSSSACASIETAMHAVLPQKVVVHVHSVNTIAWAVRLDGLRQLTARLAGLAWLWIPYTSSGNSLARKIQDVRVSNPNANVFVLENHGLVICGHSCKAAEQLLAEVEERLAVEPRRAPDAQYALLERTFSGSAWSLPTCARVHALATDPTSRNILAGGVLYPCQAIFLPEIAPVAASSIAAQERCHELHRSERQPAFLLIEEQGVVASRKVTRAEREMLIGLANIVQRIDASAPLRYLTASELTGILSGEADKYRRSTDVNCHSKSSDVGVFDAAYQK